MRSINGDWKYLNFLEIPLAIFFILSVNFYYQKNFTVNLAKTFVTPPKEIKYFHFGQAMLMSDLLWIRWIQNIEQCDAVQETPIVLGKVQQYPLKPCSGGWSGQMLDRITLLDPYFKSAYILGATVVSVLVEDKVGLDEVFDRGIQHFPKDWLIPYRAAYHAMEVMKDNSKAAHYLGISGRNGAPAWVFSLASRLYTKDGAYELAERNLQELLEQDSLDEAARLKIEARLKELKAKKNQEP